MKPATVKRLKNEQAEWDDKYYIFKRNGVTVGGGMSQEEWNKIYPKKDGSSK